MKIKVSEIPPQGLDLDLTKPRDWMREFLKDRDESFLFKTPLAVHVHLDRREEEVTLDGDLSGILALRCVRCLQEFPHPIEAHFSHLYLPLAERGAHHEEHALSRDEMEEEFYRRGEIETDEVIAAQVVEEMPPYPLCREGCRGLCPRCGADLNLGGCGCPTEAPPTRMGMALAALKGRSHH